MHALDRSASFWPLSSLALYVNSIHTIRIENSSHLGIPVSHFNIAPSDTRPCICILKDVCLDGQQLQLFDERSRTWFIFLWRPSCTRHNSSSVAVMSIISSSKSSFIDRELIEDQTLLRQIYKEPPIMSYKWRRSLKDILVKA